MVSEKDFHTEEVEFSTTPPKRVQWRKTDTIAPALIGKIPNWINLMSFPIRALHTNYGSFFGGNLFKKDQNLSNDLVISYLMGNSGDWCAYSEKILLETSKGRQPIVVSPGVHINAESDQYFIRKYNAKVIGVDPTPIVPKYIDYCYKIGYFNKDQYILEPSALSSKVGTTEFSFGEDEDMGRIQGNEKNKTKVKTVNLNFIIDKYKLPAIDLLQIDIEGAEFDVIEHFEEIKVPIPQICIEFHTMLSSSVINLLTLRETKDAIKKLKNLGYHLVESYEPWYRINNLFQALLIHQDYLK